MTKDFFNTLLGCVAADDPPRTVGLDRVNLVGAAGTGKTTFGARLAPRLRLPLVPLDALVARRDGSEVAAYLQRRIVAEVGEEPRWILDGGRWRSMAIRIAAGELAVFFDLPLRRRVPRFVTRIAARWRAAGRVPMRPELAGLFWTVAFSASERSHVVRILARAAPTQPVFIVRTDAEAAAVLEGLAPEPSR